MGDERRHLLDSASGHRYGANDGNQPNTALQDLDDPAVAVVKNSFVAKVCVPFLKFLFCVFCFFSGLYITGFNLVTPNENLPDQNENPPNQNENPLVQNENPPDQNENPPDQNENPPNQNGNPPDQNENPLVQNENPPDQNENPPDQNENPPDQNENPPNQNENPPNQNENPPDQTENPPDQNENPPNQNENPLIQNENPPDQNENPPDQNEDPPDQNENPPNQNENPPDQNENPPNQHENPPDQNENPPDQHENPSDQNENPPNQNENPPDQNENPPDQNEDPPVQNAPDTKQICKIVLSVAGFVMFIVQVLFHLANVGLGSMIEFCRIANSSSLYICKNFSQDHNETNCSLPHEYWKFSFASTVATYGSFVSYILITFMILIPMNSCFHKCFSKCCKSPQENDVLRQACCLAHRKAFKQAIISPFNDDGEVGSTKLFSIEALCFYLNYFIVLSVFICKLGFGVAYVTHYMLENKHSFNETSRNFNCVINVVDTTRVLPRNFVPFSVALYFLKLSMLSLVKSQLSKNFITM